MSEWWQRAAIYQIFPRSFQDSDGDGEGDIQGIIQRLDYLSWLGIDAIWLGPIYKSPLLDSGYDVSDFRSVDPVFGSMQDFDALISEAHARDLKIILDFTPNHVSDQHPWFGESRSSRDNPKRGWFIWEDPQADGSPPNNWLDNVGNSAWTLDEAIGRYYYHRFLPEQPDLNWRNAEVGQEIMDTLRFWLDRGVDGFRMDGVSNLVEDDLLRDDPMEPEQSKGPPGWTEHVFSSDRPETHDIIADMRRLIDSYPDRVLVGEAHLPMGRLMKYYGRRQPGLHIPFNFQLPSSKPWSARIIDAAIDQYLILLPDDAWPNWVIGSHDLPRVATRVGPEQARIAAMLLLTLKGTAIMYYGDEIGAEDVEVPPEKIRDPYGTQGMNSRDPQRSPMSWSGEQGAGFTAGDPWLPLSDDTALRNVEAMQQDGKSILHLYRKLLHLRKSYRTFLAGGQRTLKGKQHVLVLQRYLDRQCFHIVLNFSDMPQVIELALPGEVVISTHMDRTGWVQSEIALRANEGIVVELSPTDVRA
jgi:alpha-glucosidase